MMRKIRPGLLVCGLGLMAPLGCMDSRPRPLDSALFIPSSISESSGTSDDSDAAFATTDPVEVPVGESPKNASILPSAPVRPLDSVQPLDPLQSPPTTMPVEMPGAEPAAMAVAPVADQPALPPGGQGVYMTLGGVLARVNNTAIYANQVLSPLKKEFAAKAREMDADSFRDFAEKEIAKQLRELIDDEMYFATSYRALSADDRKLADAITMQVRQERVSAAGGSVEHAKRLAAEDGEDFDASMKQEYRRVVHDIYMHRKIEPLIQVTADDMRDFYRINLDKLYSDKDRAQFRVIEIDPAVTGSLPAAMDKINSIREKAIHGADFLALASTENQDDFLKGRGGNPCDDGGWMERNTYRLDAVEAAVWKLEPGQITPVIQTEGALYIARLDARRMGAVRPFEDQAVQADINLRLRQQQMGELWSKSKEESIDDAIVSPSDDQALMDRMQVAVDMAMQAYAQAH